MMRKEYYNDKNKWKTRPAVSKLPFCFRFSFPFWCFPKPSFPTCAHSFSLIYLREFLFFNAVTIDRFEYPYGLTSLCVCWCECTWGRCYENDSLISSRPSLPPSLPFPFSFPFFLTSTSLSTSSLPFSLLPSPGHPPRQPTLGLHHPIPHQI